MGSVDRIIEQDDRYKDFLEYNYYTKTALRELVRFIVYEKEKDRDDLVNKIDRFVDRMHEELGKILIRGINLEQKLHEACKFNQLKMDEVLRRLQFLEQELFNRGHNND